MKLLFFTVLLSLFMGVGTVANTQTVSRIAFGSCAGQDAPQPIWEDVSRYQPDLWIWAGDNIYGDTDDMAVMRAKYARLAAIPGYADLVNSGIPILATWDDHDYGRNDAGADYPFRADSQTAFLDFFEVPMNSPRRQREGVYHAEIFGTSGQRVQVILLDTRYHRSDLIKNPPEQVSSIGRYRPNNQKTATVLGEAQWTWLREQLLQPAELRLIISSIQVISPDHHYEKWNNFPQERKKLIALIEETRAEGVVFLSGDRHHAELSCLHAPNLYPVYDLTASGINKSNPHRPGQPPRPIEPNPYRIGKQFRGHHFGSVSVDWNQPDPIVELAIVNIDGETPITKKLLLSSLRLPQTSPLQTRVNYPNQPNHEEIKGTIQLDGSVIEWTDNGALIIDEQWLYCRFRSPEKRTLRRNDRSLHLLFETDPTAAGTGQDRFMLTDVDLEITFAAPRDPENRSWGPKIQAYLANPQSITPDDILIAAAPTHASDWFEVRISMERLAKLFPSLLSHQGRVRLTVLERHKTTGELRLLQQNSLDTLPKAFRASLPSEIGLPAKPADSLRILSLNTLWASQYANPEPFGRMCKALNPDVYLIQEWDRERVEEQHVVEWFQTYVDPSRDWYVAVSGNAEYWSGTLVVTHHPIQARGPRVSPLSAGGWGFPIRFAAALIETPIGTLLAGSVHLKASGALETLEDERRFAEAEAVHHMMSAMKSMSKPELVVLGGDFNLNGDSDILRKATLHLDADSSALTPAEAQVLGDTSLLYTFGRSGLRSRLDFITYPDSIAEPVNAFVLDTAIWDDASLAQAGLQKADSEATDHLPVVIDLKFKAR